MRLPGLSVCFLVIIFVLPDSVMSQEGQIELVEEMYDKAVAYKRKREFTQAWKLFHRCENLYKSQANWVGYFSCRRQHARFVRDVDRDPFAARVIQDSCIQAIQERMGPDHAELAEFYSDLAGTVMQFSRSSESLQYFQETLRIRTLVYGPESERVAVTHLNLAYMYRQEFQWQEALEQALLAKQLLENAGSLETSFYRQAFQAVSLAYKGLGKLSEALFYSQKLLELVRTAFPDQEARWVSYMLDLASLYRNMNRVREAAATYRNMIRLIENAGGQNSRTYAKVLYQQGNLLISLNNIHEGYPALVKANGLFEKLGNGKGVDYASSLFKLASYELAHGNNLKAKDYFKRSIAAMYSGQRDETSGELHDQWTIQNPTIYLRAQFELILLQRNESVHSVDPLVVLDSALHTLHGLVDLLDYVRLTIANEADRRSWLKNQSRLYELGVLIASDGVALKPESIHFKEEMFFFSDRSRSNLMQDQRLLHPAQLALRFPKEFTDELVNTKDRLAFCNSRLQREIASGETSTITELRFQRSSLLLKQDSLLSTIKSEYPALLSEGFLIRGVSLEQVQRSLSPKELLLEYFWGTDSVYLIAITAQTITTQSIGPVQHIDEVVSTYISLLKSPEMESANEQLLSNGKQLFDIILPQGERWKTFPNWILIPDGKLSYLPFDAIAIGQNENQIEYLLHHIATRTAPSASYLSLDQKHLPTTSASLAVFAPNFSQAGFQHSESFSRNQISRLHFNRQELISINQVAHGTPYADETASKAAFLENASSYQLLHLATHAFTNDEFPEQSGLIFHSDQNPLQYDTLTGTEIEGMPLTARLAVLSACQTGTGKLLRGEGILSLSRCFQIAGCPSVIMSLWTVDDEATKDLMSGFYELLDQDYSIEQALRLAKLQYLEEHDLIHPHFWASFSLIGKDQNINLSHKTFPPFWLLMAAFFLTIIAGAIMMRKRNITKK